MDTVAFVHGATAAVPEPVPGAIAALGSLVTSQFNVPSYHEAYPHSLVSATRKVFDVPSVNESIVEPVAAVNNMPPFSRGTPPTKCVPTMVL